MEREKNLYMYVYRMLLTSIYNGTYAYHEKLPVLTKLCDTYQVGRNTVRNALSELANGGYVTLQKGVQATVIFDIKDLNGNEQYRQALMDIRDTTKDVYDTMQWVLPELFMDCFHHETLDFDEIKDLLKKFTLENIHNENELIERMYDIYLYVFKSSHNPILVDLFVTLMSYAYQPLIPEEQSYTKLKRSVNGIRKGTMLILKFVQAKQDKIVKNLIRKMTQTHAYKSLQYIETLCNDLTPQHTTRFVWVCNRDQEYLYAKVVLDILVNISDQTYQIGDILPSISELSHQYDVSDRTTRKALQILRDYQIIETMNGVGSNIIKVTFTREDDILKDQKVKENLITYCYTLKVFTILCKAIMPRVLKVSSPEELIDIMEEMKQSSSKTLGYLSSYIFEKTNSCLFTIYKEMNKTLTWSVFANMFGNHQQQEDLHQELIEALSNNDCDKIYQSFMQILQMDATHIASILETI